MKRVAIDHACLTPDERASKYKHMKDDRIVQIRGPKWRSVSDRESERAELRLSAQRLGDGWAV